ncbi:MAG TPA: DNRLRE domain-containing protein [Verrucomicrobiae bacterium]|jgi:hypothetical protein|nr:DNRLRE domain-containing protein [Verrucomicrobiae bacterium]
MFTPVYRARRVAAALVLGAVCAGPARAWHSALYPVDWQPPSVAVGFETNKLIQDFSYAGYHAGEAPIPNRTGTTYDVSKAPYNADKTGAQDATTAIQNAINSAQAAGGGIVFLPAGVYAVKPPGTANYALRITAGNVVLRGAGAGQTFLLNTSTNMRSKSIVLVTGPSGAGFYASGTATATIRQDLLGPATVLPVNNINGIQAGDWVAVRADCTDAWITEHNEPDWIGYGDDLQGVAYFRQVVSVSSVSNTITIAAPTRYYLKTRDNARVVRLGSAPAQECGLEDFSIGNVQGSGTGWGEDDYTDSTKSAYYSHDSYAIKFSYARNGWVRSVQTFQAAGNSTTCDLLSNGLLFEQCSQMTATNCSFQRPQYGGGGGNGYMYRINNGNECLMDNCHSTFTRHSFVLSSMASSGNVFHECVDKDSGHQTGDTGSQTTAGSNSDHHMHFSHGNLIDACTGDNSVWEARYRPYGSPPLHDLTAAHSVYWNTQGINGGPSYVVMSEQSRYGYVIGTRGTRTGVNLSTYGGTKCDPPDYVEGTGQGGTLEPFSLYDDQLARRLGRPRILLPASIVVPFPANSVHLTADPGGAGATWQVISSTGTVIFSDATVTNPLVTFGARGTNVLQITTSNAAAQTMVILAPDALVTTNLTATATTYVRDGAYAGSNYAGDGTLQVKVSPTAGFNRRAFLRFDAPSLAWSDYNRAILELSTSSPPAAGSQPTLNLNLVADNTWNPATVTWNTQPAAGALIASWVMSTTGLDRIDVTAAAPHFNFRLSAASEPANDNYIFTAPPQLMLDNTNTSVGFDGAVSVAPANGGVTLHFAQRKQWPADDYYVIETAPALDAADWEPAPGIDFTVAGDLGDAYLMNAFIPVAAEQAFYRFRVVRGS